MLPLLAATVCTFNHGDFTSQAWGTTCSAEMTMPAGCPLDYTGPVGFMPPAQVDVLRGGQDVAIDATTVHVDTVDETVDTIDFESCDCAHTTVAEPMDRFTLTAATLEGDVVSIPDTSIDGSQFFVTITAAATCPDPVWPTQFSETFACDLCPPDPTGSGSGSGSDPGSGSGASKPLAGCAAGGNAGWPIALVLGGLLARRRRR